LLWSSSAAVLEFVLHSDSFTRLLRFVMMSDSGSAFETTPVEKFTGHFKKVQRQYQQTLDRWTPHVIGRWLSTGGLLALFFLRIVFAQGVSFIPVKTLQNFIYLSSSGTLVRVHFLPVLRVFNDYV